VRTRSRSEGWARELGASHEAELPDPRIAGQTGGYQGDIDRHTLGMRLLGVPEHVLGCLGRIQHANRGTGGSGLLLGFVFVDPGSIADEGF
jgi:hypothetical protein